MKTIHYTDVSMYDISTMRKIIDGKLKVIGKENHNFNPEKSSIIKFSDDKNVKKGIRKKVIKLWNKRI